MPSVICDAVDRVHRAYRYSAEEIASAKTTGDTL